MGKKEDCGENKNREEGHRDLIVAKWLFSDDENGSGIEWRH